MGQASHSRRSLVVVVLHRLDVLAIQHEFAFALEDFAGRADEAKFVMFRLFVEIGVDRVALKSGDRRRECLLWCKEAAMWEWFIQMRIVFRCPR